MFDALTYQEMLKEIKKNSEKYGITDDVVAILITRPDLATGKDILNSLEYYHFKFNCINIPFLVSADDG